MSAVVHEVGADVHEHLVGFYDRDDELVSAVANFFGEGLRQSERVVAVATPEHRAAFERALAADGFAIDDLIASGSYHGLDARDTLDTFLRGGTIDAGAFRSQIGRVVASSDGRAVRVFGEMVGLLWNAGDLASAIELESMWNELSRRYPFMLYCAYEMSAMQTTGDLAATKQVCDQHSHVISLSGDRSDTMAAAQPGVDGSSERMFVPTPAVLRAVRAFVTDTLRIWDAGRLAGDAAIVACELATNALVHARSPFFVCLSHTRSVITIAVRDTSIEAPEHLAPDPDRIGGRGIPLIAALSQAWGSVGETDGKTVWVELPV